MSHPKAPAHATDDLAAGAGTLRLSLPSDTGLLHLVTNLARNSALAAGLDERDANKLALATDEAVTNVIEHAYHGEKNHRIDVVVRLLENRVEIHIVHDGDPINEEVIPRQIDLADSARQKKRGGLGVVLMRRLVDRVDFRSTADLRSECCLVKDRSASKPTSAENSRARAR